MTNPLPPQLFMWFMYVPRGAARVSFWGGGRTLHRAIFCIFSRRIFVSFVSNMANFFFGRGILSNLWVHWSRGQCRQVWCMLNFIRYTCRFLMTYIQNWPWPYCNFSKANLLRKKSFDVWKRWWNFVAFRRKKFHNWLKWLAQNRPSFLECLQESMI